MKLLLKNRSFCRGQVSVVLLIFLFCCIIGGCFLWVRSQRELAEVAEREKVVEVPVEKIAEKPAQAKIVKVKPVEPDPIPVVVPKIKEPEVVKKPEVVKPKVKTEVDLLLEKNFPLPNYKSLEDLVKNWSDVPVRAFPDEVMVHVALDYKSVKSGEAKTMEAEHLAKPVEFHSGILTVVSLDDFGLRGQISMAATDFKDRVMALYEQKKKEGVLKVLAKREKNREKAEVYLANLKKKAEEGEDEKQTGDRIVRRGGFSSNKYGRRYHGDYWPETKNGKNSEYDHEVPMGPIGGAMAVLYGERKAKIVGLWKKGPGAKSGMKVGDLLVKVNGKKLHKYEKSAAAGPVGAPEDLGLAMIDAQASDRPLEITVMRDGEEKTFEVDLPALPPFEDKLSADCVRSQALVDAATEYLMENQRDDGLWPTNDYANAWCGLALLSTGNPKYVRKAKKTARTLADRYDMGSKASLKKLYNGGDTNNWKVAMVGIFLAEYYLATGDKAVCERLIIVVGVWI